VEHELLRGESKQGVGAGIACRRGRKHNRNEGSKRTRIRAGRPRNEILNVLALSRRENGEEKRCGRLSAITRGSDDAERALSNPATASFVAKRRTPSTTANDFPGWAATVGNRASAGDQ
jgi:hypothetical protein